MKRCKCISDEFFKLTAYEETNIKVGDVLFYQEGDIISMDDCLHCLIELYDDKGKVVLFILDTHFKRNFKDLVEYRKGKIDDFLKDNDGTV